LTSPTWPVQSDKHGFYSKGKLIPYVWVRGMLDDHRVQIYYFEGCSPIVLTKEDDTHVRVECGGKVGRFVTQGDEFTWSKWR